MIWINKKYIINKSIIIIINFFWFYFFKKMDYIDYNDMKMSFIGLRKHFFKDKFYFIYVFEEFIVMATVVIYCLY